MINNWILYDELIKKIPENLYPNDIIIGDSMCGVLLNENLGVAMACKSGIKSTNTINTYKTLTLKELAKLSKSWDFIEASIGISAINSYFNNKNLLTNKSSISFLDSYKYYVKGKKVAVIGHFPYIKKVFGDICEVIILEREIIDGDYPDTACEYLIPNIDVVFITGSAFVNKSITRLIQIAHNKDIIIVGPSTPMCSSLYKHNIIGLSGFVVTDTKNAIKTLYNSSMDTLFNYGQMINLKS